MHITKKCCSLLVPFCLIVGILFYFPTNASAASEPTVNYKVHVQDLGWLPSVKNGASAGTTGRCLRVEALSISIQGTSGGIKYRAHVQDLGWQNWVNDGACAGTTGKCLQTEAVQIKLTGGIATSYEVYYRVHMANLGWGDWAANGATAGTVGEARRIECIQIKLMPKKDANNRYMTVTYDCSNMNAWINSVVDSQDSSGGIIVAQNVLSYKTITRKVPVSGPSYNGESPYITETIKVPYQVRYKIHTHTRAYGYGQSWVYTNGSIETLYTCKGCSLRKSLVVWEIPFPDSSDAQTTQTVISGLPQF